MLVSILLEVRFDTSGSVRTRSFEVLPFQIYSAGGSTDPEVVQRSGLVYLFSIIRVICAIYTGLIILLKLYYRDALGLQIVFFSVLKDSV